MSNTDERVRRQLARILDSETFRNAARLRAFLRFVVEETLAGRHEEIKEYAIGRDVCARPPSFDPKADPIVRVDASRLRSKLEAYYQTEGFDSDLLIELPKGGYVPAFTERSLQTPAGDGPVSLAVRPFVNLNLPGDHDYVADSLTEELIHRLARLNGLQVIARSSVFQSKGKSEDAREFGKRLGVKYVLEGSARVAGVRLRVTAQLIDSRRGWLLWSEKYECDWQEILTIQDEIAASITDALKVKLSGKSGQAVFQHVTEDPYAYADYLRGRYFWNQRTPEALSESVRCYEAALARDSQCAPAFAGLADTLAVMAINDQAPSLPLMPRAHAAVRRALELRPGWAEALTSLGFIKSVFDWDWEGAARDFEDAIAGQPGYSTAHHLYGVVNLMPCRRWHEAIGCLQTALRLDPISPVLLRDLGIVHFLSRSWDEAQSYWRRAEELAPAYRGCLYWRARLLMETGKSDEAIAALEARLDAGGANTRVLATLAYVHARCGATAKAAAILDELTNRESVQPLDFATIYLGLGYVDQALDCLEKACESRQAALYQFGVDPLYDPVRAHPRGEALRLAMNLPR